MSASFGLITVCGAGALGGNLVEFLARQGYPHVRVIDNDRVEQRNLGTQPYRERDVGSLKVEILSELVFEIGLGGELQTDHHRLDEQTVHRGLRGSALVVDCFDNAPSRRIVQAWCDEQGVPCVHAGLSADGYGEIRWDHRYQPGPGGGNGVCENPLARSLVLIVVSVLAEVIGRYVRDGVREEYAVTGRDLRITALREREFRDGPEG